MTQKIPNSKIVTRIDGKFVEKDITEYFKGKKIVAFALPGAFTPTCSNYHVPAYEEEFENLKNILQKILLEKIIKSLQYFAQEELDVKRLQTI